MKEKYKIMLVNAPNSNVSETPGNYAIFPAMGVVSLATRLKRDFNNLEIKVIDGGTSSTGSVLKEVDKFAPNLVAISVLTPTYSEGLKVAKYAKDNHNSKIVLGNDHASFFPELILSNRPYIDYTVQAEIGEIPLSYIIGREMEDSIKESLVSEEGVYFRDEKGLKRIPFPKLKLPEVYRDYQDIPDIDFIEDYSQIVTAYNNRYGQYHKSERRPIVVNNVRGCGNGKRRCSYCSIYDLSLNVGNPNFFWDMVKKYNWEHGINFFFEACDSFLSFPKYIRKLLDSKPFNPKDRDIELEVYARANDVVNLSESIRWLKGLNVTRVNLGLDSGDDNMLQFLRKQNRHKQQVYSPSQINYEAVKRLAEAGITIHASFPLGSLGETQSSLENTLGFIEEISKNFGYGLTTLEASELVPLPNSPSWDMLLSRDNSVFDFNGGIESTLSDAGIRLRNEVIQELRAKYDNQDLLNVDELAKDWVKYFTHISWEDIEASKEKAEKYARKAGAVYGRAT